MSFLAPLFMPGLNTYLPLAGQSQSSVRFPFSRSSPPTRPPSLPPLSDLQTFTSSFTGLYHDTTLAGVAVHDDRLRRHALLQENRLERRRTKCVQMQSLAFRYQNRYV